MLVLKTFRKWFHLAPITIAIGKDRAEADGGGIRTRIETIAHISTFL